MSDRSTEQLLDELQSKTGANFERIPESSDDGQSERSVGVPVSGMNLERSLVNEHLDELIIAILFRCEEANGMDIIREFAQQFGVQFSPGSVYPQLHSLEEEGVLACRECVRSKKYRIDDPEQAAAYLDSMAMQLSCLTTFLGETEYSSDNEPTMS